jgi:hypothetical protein
LADRMQQASVLWHGAQAIAIVVQHPAMRRLK